MLKDSVLEMLKVFFFFADELKAPFIPALPTTLTLVTYTYESRRALTHPESCCEIPSPDSYESYRYLLNQSGAQSASPGETHDSEP